MNKDGNTSQDLLNDAIREATGMADKNPRVASARPAAAPAADLRSVLNELTGPAGGAIPTRAKITHPMSVTGVNDLIREASSGHSVGLAGISVAAKPDQTIAAPFGQAVQDVYASPQTAVTDTGAGSGLSLRNRVLGALLIILLAAGSVLWWWSNHQQSGPSGTLHELAKAAEHYRVGHNGQLPKELATLGAFPKDAVEWPLRYWNARDAAGRTEIIWVPMHSGHYRILLRQGSEAWTVSDRERTPKLILKGQL